jgi:hypothetical protein
MIKGLLKFLFGVAVVTDGDSSSVKAGTATVNDVTVFGNTKESLTSPDVVITLSDNKFKAIAANTDVSDWFTGNLPGGLVAKVKTAILTTSAKITIRISGKPGAEDTGELNITIPGDRLVGTPTPPPITVDVNPNAKYDILPGIATLADFAAFATAVNGGQYSLNARLAADITVPANADYLPIAPPVMGPDGKLIFNPYTGTFDGNGHTINITLSGSASYLALFAFNNGTIKNVTVAGSVTAVIPDPLPAPDFSIDYIAGVVAYNDIGGLITRVISTVTVNAESDETHCIGGIAGFNGWDGNNTDSPHFDPRACSHNEELTKWQEKQIVRDK